MKYSKKDMEEYKKQCKQYKRNKQELKMQDN